MKDWARWELANYAAKRSAALAWGGADHWDIDLRHIVYQSARTWRASVTVDQRVTAVWFDRNPYVALRKAFDLAVPIRPLLIPSAEEEEPTETRRLGRQPTGEPARVAAAHGY